MLEIELPIDATDFQIEEWLRFNLGISNAIRLANPLVDQQFIPTTDVTWWKPTRLTEGKCNRGQE
jgi:hypothetical protein